MVALAGGIVILVLLIGFLLVFVLLSHQRERADADACALALAQKLNDTDRLGQINTLVERSRELVYASRSAYQGCAAEEGYTNIEDLSRLLLEEARVGAQLVESGRRTLTDEVVADAKTSAKIMQERLHGERKTSLGWLSVNSPRLVSAEIGYIQKMPSNVKAPEALEILKQSDIKSGYLDSSGRVYAGNINARLPSPDNDLEFNICSLPFPFNQTSSPPRLTSTSVFAPWAVLFDGQAKPAPRPAQLPSAVRIRVEMPVSTAGSELVSNKIQTAASASAAGGLPPPDDTQQPQRGRQ
ncbi:MAG TPA: hypothetical protein V6D17_14665 [Candidatus Obscuribacterales bacterium]